MSRLLLSLERELDAQSCRKVCGSLQEKYIAAAGVITTQCWLSMVSHALMNTGKHHKHAISIIFAIEVSTKLLRHISGSPS